MGTGNPAIHYVTAVGLIAWGQWAVELMVHTALLPEGTRQWNSLCPLPHWGASLTSGLTALALGSGAALAHFLSGLEQWAMYLLQYTTTMLGSSGRRDSCNTAGGGGVQSTFSRIFHISFAFSGQVP